MFVLGGYSGKLKGKSLSDYLINKPAERSKAEEALAFFRAMKAKGLPVEITRVERVDG